MTEYRAGILWVGRGFEARARLALPPEHKVAAIRDDPDNKLEHWLIEGPRMPLLTASGAPDVVSLQLTASWPDDQSEYRLDASLWHDPDNSYRIGVWPDFESFRAAFQG
jgi:hypothetical protein